MKFRSILALPTVALLAACADTRTKVTFDQTAASAIPESGPVTRGRPETYTPRVAVENAQLFDAAMFADLRSNFLTPIEGSAYRYTIDSITFDADANSPGVWALVVVLDTGAEVKLDDIVPRDAEGRTHFSQSYRRMITALNRVRSGDGALDRYVQHWASR